MRSSWFYRQGRRSQGAQILWVAFGLIVVMFYFTRRVLLSLHAGGWSKDVDQPAYQWVLAHQDPMLAKLAEIFFWWGSTPGMTITMLIVAVLLCWKAGNVWPLGVVAFTTAVSTGLTVILKNQFVVVRPGGVPGMPAPPSSYSFPSGHTLNAAALIGIAAYLAIVYGLRRYAYLIGTLATIFVLAMGASRIYLGHHWVSDVMVGLLIGAGWAAVVAILHYTFVLPKQIH